MSESGWTVEQLKDYYAERDKRVLRDQELQHERDVERSREVVIERGKRFLSEQERVRAAKGFVGALSEMAQPPHALGCICVYCNRPAKPTRKPRIRGVAPKEDRSYEGRVYHSKNEMLYAAKLDLLLKAGKIQRVEPQVRIPLVVNKELVCTMVADFLVVNNDGTKEYHEIKGMESDVWKLKRKLLKACRPDINYIVVKV